MKKIIQVVDTLNAGGAERVAIDLANGLLSTGYQVFFCVTRNDGPLHAELDDAIVFTNLHRRRSYQGLISFRRYVERNDISIVHAHGNSTALFCVMALFGLPSVKIIHHDHNPLLSFRNTIIQKLTLKHVNAWITVSKEILQWVVSEIGYTRAKMLMNPIQISRFRKALSQARITREIIVLANYREQKNYENLLGAIHLLKQGDLKFIVSCYGSHSQGAYFNKIRTRTEELNMTEMVSLNSSVMNVPELLSHADIGLLSSASEGLPISLLEYMASSLPVIVTDVGECGRIVREANCGIVVPAGDSVALAKAIETIMQNQDKWFEWGINGRKYIEENHSFDVYLKKMIHEVYEKL